MTQSTFRNRVHEIIFEADTKAGKAFDIALLWLIGLSIVVVSLETVYPLNQQYEKLFDYLEWGFTILFTIEYLLRIYTILKPWKYITSFYGIVDLLSILPTYISLIFATSPTFITIRALRFLRVFRVLKLANYLHESRILVTAIQNSRTKITVFLGAVLTAVVIVGSAMYLIEGQTNDAFTSIPRSIYWAIVTITTVGYGDITPTTSLGQFFSAVLMILGYGVIAVPTGIVSVELSSAQEKSRNKLNTISCPSCSREGHDSDAEFCKFCGSEL